MAKVLFKESTITGDPGSPGVPASPGIPARDSYFMKVEPVPVDPSVQLWLATSALESGFISQAQFIQNIVDARRFGLNNDYVLVPATDAIPGTPGIPATESTLVTDLNIGWNAGARSVQAEPGPFEITFTFSEPTVAAMAGINSAIDTGAATIDIGWGFEYRRGAVRVVESDTFIVVAPATVSAGAVFKIVRDGAGLITYFIDAALVYTSLKQSLGVAFLDGIIYSADSE